MSVGVYTLGLNHVSAPVSVREQISLSEDLIKPAVQSLRSAFGGAVHEAAVLSTCNRTEIYCAADIKAVLDHPRKNRKSGKVHGTPLAPWRQQPSSRLECCLALKRMLEFAVEDCHQPQRWLIGTTEYMRLRGAPPNRADRAALSDAECLQLFEELDKKVNRGWGDVARIFRVYGIRMWEMNFLAVRPNWKNEPQLYVTKGKTFTKKGIKRETNPRFLEPLPVVNETFGLLEKISSGALVLPTGKDGNTMAISGANFGKNLR